MNSAKISISCKSQGESKRHEHPVVSSRVAAGKEGVEKRDSRNLELDEEPDLCGESMHTLLSTDSTLVFRNRLLRGVGRANASRAQQIVTLIAGGFSATITKNAATAVTTTLTAASFADWSSYASLYDEVTLIGGDIWFTYDATGMAPSATVSGAVAWDSVDGATPGSALDLICYRDHCGPINISISDSQTTGQVHPVPRSGFSGFYHIPMRPSRMSSKGLGKRPELSVNSLTPVNMWMIVSMSSLNFGFVKAYFGNPNAANAGSIGYIARVKVAFRLRAG